MFRNTGIRRCRRVVFLILAASLCATGAWAEESEDAAAQERRAATQAAARAKTEAVIARIAESADFLAKQKRFRFEARTRFEVLQTNDQMLEFGSTQIITARRPDRVRIESLDRNGEARTLKFDGERIGIELPAADAYVMVEKPGTLEAAVEYLVDDLDTPAPLHEFITDNYFDQAKESVLSAFWVDTEQMGSEVCDHFAFRGARVDVQLWLRTGDAPLPCRIVITHVEEHGWPEFAADFESWDLDPKTPDALFRFEPPEGAERLTLQAGKQTVIEGRGKP